MVILSLIMIVVGVTKLDGLETNVKLRSLFLQENMIEKMEGLDTLTDLR